MVCSGDAWRCVGYVTDALVNFWRWVGGVLAMYWLSVVDEFVLCCELDNLASFVRDVMVMCW